MNSFEKEILNNKNLETPSENVLDRAKSAMPENKKKKLNSKQIFAIVSACIVVSIVCSTIPAMIPANSQMPYIENEMMQTSEITSLEDNIFSNATFLYFDKFEKMYRYDYEDKTMFVEEFSIYDDIAISLLVCVGYRDGRSFEKEEEYIEFLGVTQECLIGKTIMYWINIDDAVYITFWHNDHQYYLKISGDINNWQSFLQKELF